MQCLKIKERSAIIAEVSTVYGGLPEGETRMGKVLQWLDAPFVLRRLMAARQSLADATPLTRDCGSLCGAACCQPEESGDNGMLLLPFEERLYQKPIDGFSYELRPDDTLYKGGWRLVCDGQCPREHRPFACRVFPLRIRIVDAGQEDETSVQAEVDPRAWACCPLPEEGGLRAVRADFIAAVEAAGHLLTGNAYLLEALLNEQRMLDDTRKL